MGMKHLFLIVSQNDVKGLHASFFSCSLNCSELSFQVGFEWGSGFGLEGGRNPRHLGSSWSLKMDLQSVCPSKLFQKVLLAEWVLLDARFTSWDPYEKDEHNENLNTLSVHVWIQKKRRYHRSSRRKSLRKNSNKHDKEETDQKRTAHFKEKGQRNKSCWYINVIIVLRELTHLFSP